MVVQMVLDDGPHPAVADSADHRRTVEATARYRRTAVQEMLPPGAIQFGHSFQGGDRPA